MQMLVHTAKLGSNEQRAGEVAHRLPAIVRRLPAQDHRKYSLVFLPLACMQLWF